MKKSWRLWSTGPRQVTNSCPFRPASASEASSLRVITAESAPSWILAPFSHCCMLQSFDADDAPSLAVDGDVGGRTKWSRSAKMMRENTWLIWLVNSGVMTKPPTTSYKTTHTHTHYDPLRYVASIESVKQSISTSLQRPISSNKKFSCCCDSRSYTGVLPMTYTGYWQTIKPVTS